MTDITMSSTIYGIRFSVSAQFPVADSLPSSEPDSIGYEAIYSPEFQSEIAVEIVKVLRQAESAAFLCRSSYLQRKMEQMS